MAIIAFVHETRCCPGCALFHAAAKAAVKPGPPQSFSKDKIRAIGLGKLHTWVRRQDRRKAGPNRTADIHFALPRDGETP